MQSDIIAEGFTNRNFGAVSIVPAYVALDTKVSKASFSFLPLAEEEFKDVMFREWTKSNQKAHEKFLLKHSLAQLIVLLLSICLESEFNARNFTAYFRIVQ